MAEVSLPKHVLGIHLRSGQCHLEQETILREREIGCTAPRSAVITVREVWVLEKL